MEEKKPMTRKEVETGITKSIEEVFPELSQSQKAKAVKQATTMAIKAIAMRKK